MQMDMQSQPEAPLTWETLGARVLQVARAATCVHLIEAAIAERCEEDESSGRSE